jgi:hypothetical protein
MRISIRLLISVLLAVSAACAQDGFFFGSNASSAARAFTIVQTGINNDCTASPTCTVTMGSPLTAGNLYVFYATSDARIRIAAVSAGGTLVQAPGCSMPHAQGSELQPSCAYILPSTSTGGTATVTLTMSGIGFMFAYIVELHPSTSGALVGLDCDSGLASPIPTGTTALGPSCVFSGTNDAMFQFWEGDDVNGNLVSAVTSPYAANVTFPYAPPTYAGWAVNPAAANGTGPSWTTTGASTYATGALAFGWNTTPCLEQLYNDFEGGTNGATVTLASLLASTHGFQGSFQVGAPWVIYGTITYQTAASMPLQNATGRLCGDGVSYPAGAGSMGIAETGAGIAVLSALHNGWNPSVGSATGTASAWFMSDLPATDTSTYEMLISGSGSSLAQAQLHGTGSARVFQLTNDTGGASSGTIPYTPGDWVNVQVQYSADPSYGGTGIYQMAVYNTSGAQIGSTLTLAQGSVGNYVGGFIVGHPTAEAVTSGYHNYWDSVKVSLVGTFPLTR